MIWILNKVTGADVRIRLGRPVVRVEVKRAIVVVGVPVAADIKHVGAGVGVHETRYSAQCADSPYI